MALRRSGVRIPLGPHKMGQAQNLPLHILREAGVVSHPPESEELWCEPRTALQSAQAELAGGFEKGR